jgi:hypothetical protein
VRADDVREPYILHRRAGFRFFPIAAVPLCVSAAPCGEWVWLFDHPITRDHRIIRSRLILLSFLVRL